MSKLPERKYIYQNHTLNSKNWDKYIPRDDDIIVATPYKSGTTWMQTIIMRLIFMDTENRILWDLSPWIDSHGGTEVVEKIEDQTHRRFIKSHLPLDALPYFSQVKYIVVNRDARDVFMSLWNHYKNLEPAMIRALNTVPDYEGEPFPVCPEDIHECWTKWMTRSFFAWETEGYPYWSCLRHAQTWWNFRHLPNILHVHYNDLLQDLEGEIRRIAAYLEIAVPEDILLKIVDAVTFKSMKENAEKIVPGLGRAIQGGSQTFINKGTNGRWRDVLTEDDLTLYEAAVQRELTPDCAAWLENGWLKEK